ncbi:MAG: DUF1307 domain-containing protein [Aerococcaceae bacterium]|nr:DUF1307 domain-containing protein [Aerococcaceae bacterium]
MKKLLTLMSVLFVFVLAGCAAQITEHKYKVNITGLQIEVTYKAQGDHVLEQITHTTYKYSDMELTKEEFEQEAAPVVEFLKEIKGVSHTITFGEEQAVEIVAVNFKEFDFDKIEEIERFGLDGIDAKAKTISLEKSLENLKMFGFKEVK